MAGLVAFVFVNTVVVATVIMVDGILIGWSWLLGPVLCSIAVAEGTADANANGTWGSMGLGAERSQQGSHWRVRVSRELDHFDDAKLGALVPENFEIEHDMIPLF